MKYVHGNKIRRYHMLSSSSSSSSVCSYNTSNKNSHLNKIQGVKVLTINECRSFIASKRRKKNPFSTVTAFHKHVRLKHTEFSVPSSSEFSKKTHNFHHSQESTLCVCARVCVCKVVLFIVFSFITELFFLHSAVSAT